MKKVDYHLHSHFSADSEEDPRAHVLEALANGLEEICFTEHRDFHFPGMAFDLDVPAYFAAIQALQTEFAGEIVIKIGLEMGLDPHYQDEIEEFVASSPYDFVIGSVHELDDVEVYYDTDYYVGKSKHAAHLQYLEGCLLAAKTFDCFDTFGHLDYVARYGPYADKLVNFSEFDALLNEILSVLVAKNKALEVNTRLFNETGTLDFYRFLLTRFHDLGGKLVTLGTDSHVAKRDWAAIASARELISACGFSELATFSNRKVQTD